MSVTARRQATVHRWLRRPGEGLVLTSELVAAFKDAARRASWSRRLNIAVDCDRDHLDLILAPEVIDETNFVQDGVILDG